MKTLEETIEFIKRPYLGEYSISVSDDTQFIEGMRYACCRMLRFINPEVMRDMFQRERELKQDSRVPN